MYIHRDWSSCPHLCSSAEQTSLAVGSRDGCKWASSVYWKWGGVGQRECWWWWGSSWHGSCPVCSHWTWDLSTIPNHKLFHIIFCSVEKCSLAKLEYLTTISQTWARESWHSWESCGCYYWAAGEIRSGWVLHGGWVCFHLPQQFPHLR